VSEQKAVSSKDAGNPVRKTVIRLALGTLLLTVGFRAEAQRPEKVFRIGVLASPSASYISYRLEAFRQRLRELGYVEGKNVVIEYRYAEGRLDRLPDLAAELVGLKVEVIVTVGPAIKIAMKASSTIPIVTAGSSDPVGDGIVYSLARPGGNITGLSLRFPELDRKRLELLREAFPKVARVALLWASTTERGTPALIDVEAEAKALRLELLSLEVRSLQDLDNALARAKKEGAQALVAASDPRINMQLRQILEFAEKNRLPAIYAASEFVEAGGLMSYGPNYREMFRRVADFVDKILKGTKPANIPFEQPTKLELVINLRTAKQIGVTIHPEVLMWADRVINDSVQ
jgi:putative tryptophan/tyrosine transport system substrate-binding protein